MQDILIKNGNGEYVDFDGVRKTTHDKYIEIILSSNKTIKCSFDHKFIIHDKIIVANKLCIGDMINSHEFIIDKKIINDTIDLYDPVNVRGTHTFYHDDNIISHNCNFIGSSQTLISSEALLGLQARDPIKSQYGIRYYAEPVEGHDYIMTVDVSRGRGQDYSTFTVFDISTNNSFNQVCTYRDNMISPLMFPELIVRAAKTYNNALVVVENNDAGQVVCNAVYYDYEYDNTFVQSSVKSSGIGVTMTKRVKRIGCSNLKDLVEGGKLHIYDADTICELSSFEPKGDSYSARGSTHDDMVMNLVLFAWFVSTDAFGGMSNVDLKQLLYNDKIKEMEDDLPPFGILSNRESEKPESMLYYEQQRRDIDEWNML
jgi:hypothetical protein